MYTTHRYCKIYSALVNTLRPTAAIADMKYAHCGGILGCDRTPIPKPSRLLTVLEGFCDHHTVYVHVRAGMSISIYEPLDRFSKSVVNAVPLENTPLLVPLENISLLISYICNNNMAVARACEVEAT
jgi:hypothetical protein